MPPPLRVLILEDQGDDVELMLRELRREGFTPVWKCVETEKDYLECLHTASFDVILADYSLPQFDAVRALSLAQERAGDIPFIIVSGSISEEVAVYCMKHGAADYLLKDRLGRLGPAVTQALHTQELYAERRRAEAREREDAAVAAALARIGQELIAFLDTPLMLERLCQLTADVLTADVCFTLLRKPQKHDYAIAAQWGVPAIQPWPFLSLDLSRSTLASLLERLETEAIAEVRSIDTQGLLPENWFSQLRLQRVLCLPLRHRQELTGVHVCGYGSDSESTSTQRRIAREVAQLASLAFANAKLVEELEQANTLKSEFVATMSHELRTPLNVIMGYTDLLLEGTFDPVTEEQEKILQKVGGSTEELLTLISSILDVSRLETRRVSVEVGEVDVPGVVKELRREIEQAQGNPDLSFTWKVGEALPPFYSDGEKLKVILKSLLSNAVKFTPKGKVTICARPYKRGMEITVSDTGIGIPAEMIPSIFEMFRQADSSTKRAYGGVGLGLYLVRQLLNILGGAVSVESTVGVGSTFHVWVPDLRTLKIPEAIGTVVTLDRQQYK